MRAFIILIIIFSSSGCFVVVYAQDGFYKLINERETRPGGHIVDTVTYIQDFSSAAKVQDLSEEIKTIFNQSRVIYANKAKITLWFLEIDKKTESEIVDKLAEVVLKTQEGLWPLTTGNLNVYLLPTNKIKSNFKLSFETDGTIFNFVKPYSSIKDLSLNCDNGYSFGNNIFLDIPHELTHNSLKNLIDQSEQGQKDYPRWLDEGLAEFTSYAVASKLAPCWVNFRSTFTVPEVSLNRYEVRTNLFKWRKDNAVIKRWLKNDISDEKLLWNEMTFYGASYRLIESDFGPKGTKRLNELLTLLDNLTRKRNKPLISRELLTTYAEFTGNYFESDPGLIQYPIQTLVQDATKQVLQDLKDGLPNGNKLIRYKSLSILASTDEPIDSELIRALLEIRRRISSVDKKSKLDNTYLGLISTVFSMRLKDKKFTEAFFALLNPDNAMRKQQIAVIRKNLIAQSYRPVHFK